MNVLSYFTSIISSISTFGGMVFSSSENKGPVHGVYGYAQSANRLTLSVDSVNCTLSRLRAVQKMVRYRDDWEIGPRSQSSRVADDTKSDSERTVIDISINFALSWYSKKAPFTLGDWTIRRTAFSFATEHANPTLLRT